MMKVAKAPNKDGKMTCIFVYLYVATYNPYKIIMM